MPSQERLFKINKVIFYLTYQKFHWQEFQEFQELFMPEFQYRSNAKSRIKFIKTRVIFRYHTKDISNQVSSNWDHEIKSYSCSNSSTKMWKTKNSMEHLVFKN